jgi:cytoskeleton protein RodZ
MADKAMTEKDSLGLRAKREAQGLTLRDVFRRTRVSMIYLEAIENGDFHHLPIPIYTRNFIKSYALALNIDNKPILDRYDAYLAALQISAIRTQDKVPEKESFLERVEHYKNYIWTVSVIIIVFIVALLISQQYKSSSELKRNHLGNVTAAPAEDKIITTNPQEKPSVSSTEQIKANTLPSTGETNKQLQVTAKQSAVAQKNIGTVNSPPEKKAFFAVNTPQMAIGLNEGPGILQIKAKEETWLRIAVDQNPPSQILLKPGEKIERKGAIFEMDIGNAGGIKMQFRGKTIENLGKSGEVIHLRLP